MVQRIDVDISWGLWLWTWLSLPSCQRSCQMVLLLHSSNFPPSHSLLVWCLNINIYTPIHHTNYAFIDSSGAVANVTWYTHTRKLYLSLYIDSTVHSTTQNVGNGKKRRKREREWKRLHAGKSKLLPYVYAPGCRKRRKSLVPSDSRLKCLSNCDYLAMLTLSLQFKDNYFSCNMVPECKLITTPVAEPKKQQSVFCYIMRVSNAGLFWIIFKISFDFI